MAVITEFARFVVDQVAPTNRVGDIEGSQLRSDFKDPTVTTPPGFQKTYARYVESEWAKVTADRRIGGSGFPLVVGIALREILNSGNMALALAPLLTQGAVGLLAAHGTELQKQSYLPKMLSGEWTATMDLTEANAGSDVGAICTQAVPAGDGTFRVTGTKTLITYGDHDLAENIIHFVLARITGAPAGAKGISCFLVPKYLPSIGLPKNEGAGGERLGQRNAIRVTAVANKMGIRAAPACDLEYDHAIGYLVGEENRGLKVMFTMMNTARLGVAAAALGLCEAAWQRARHYARNRYQGQAPGATEASSPVVEHPDVRRMLLTMKASTEALRAVVFFTAAQGDLGRHDPPAARLASLLTPVAKAWGSDLACEVTSLAMQVFGGVGYCEDAGVAQLFRDARVTSIYEGTNGVQAADLVSRKLLTDGGVVMADLVARVQLTSVELQSEPALASIGDRLEDALGVLRQSTEWILTNGAADPAEALAAATPYLRVVGLVTGGWLLGVEALAAAPPSAFAEAKIATARFYSHHLLPSVHGLLPTILAGKNDLFALDADRL